MYTVFHILTGIIPMPQIGHREVREPVPRDQSVFSLFDSIRFPTDKHKKFQWFFNDISRQKSQISKKFQWFFNDIFRQKSQIFMIILNIRKLKNTVPHVKHDLLTHLTSTKECFSKQNFHLITQKYSDNFLSYIIYIDCYLPRVKFNWPSLICQGQPLVLNTEINRSLTTIFGELCISKHCKCKTHIYPHM